MCVVPGIIPNGNWAIIAWSARVVASWGAFSNSGWTKDKKFATSWADSGVAIFSSIQPNIFFPQQA